MGELQSIRVVKVSKGRCCISVLWGGCRYRFYNGQYIGSWSKPGSLPQIKRVRAYEDLCLEYQRAIDLGWTPKEDWSDRLIREVDISKSILDDALESKLQLGLSNSYSRNLKWMVKHLKRFLKGKTPTSKLLAQFINESHWTPATRTIIRRHLIAFEKEMKKYGYSGSIKNLTTKHRIEEKLHKPYGNVGEVLGEIAEFDSKLHLCCLLAFGCLLRPHREIRLLTWGDISEDFSQVSLGGNQNKGKRNRIVPVGTYIKPYLKAFKGSLAISEDNVFTGRKEPYNPDYFKTLWSRYKRKSKLLEKDQTLYSFRHSGAIDIFKRTGSLTKLQKAMGHSSINVSLTYLRGLEVAELKEEDMPMV